MSVVKGRADEIVHRRVDNDEITGVAGLHIDDPRHENPGIADQVLKNVKGNPVAQLARSLEYQLNPMSAPGALKSYWLHKSQGEMDQAKVFYNEALAKGVPLPPL